jgi:hypothetical protein
MGCFNGRQLKNLTLLTGLLSEKRFECLFQLVCKTFSSCAYPAQNFTKQTDSETRNIRPGITQPAEFNTAR